MVSLSFTSCNKDIENCVEEMVGVFSGGQVCGGNTYDDYSVSVSAGSDFDKISLSAYGGLLVLTGTVDKDCNIVFDDATVEILGFSTTFSGTGSYNEDVLTLTTTQSANSYAPFTCTWNLTRQ